MRTRKKLYGLVLPLLLVSAGASAHNDIAVTEAGKVRGRSEDGIVSWKGIPFASPPVGRLRWRAPQPVKPWKGILPAFEYRSDCMQKVVSGEASPAGVSPAEDCLYANIWRPLRATRPLPVVVWIYGGAFVNGGASSPVFSGTNIAREGVLFFSFNYRVGRFGTFVHPALAQAMPNDEWPGNYGYMDQLAALRWVQRNIARFGGDPSNVTLIGESAGGVSVNQWLTSPLGKGLFHKAIVMSGGDGEFLVGGTDLSTEQQAGVAFAQSKGIPSEDPNALARLRALSAEEVTDGLNMYTMRDITPRTYSLPFADGGLAVAQIPAFRSGAFARVPVMIGATSADLGGPDGPMIAGARTIAQLISDYGIPTYLYRFSYVAPSQGNSEAGARHATDVPFFLGNAAIRYGVETAPSDIEMSDLISRYVVNFAKTGNPNGDALPTWSPFDSETELLMNFGQEGATQRTESHNSAASKPSASSP